MSEKTRFPYTPLTYEILNDQLRTVRVRVSFDMDGQTFEENVDCVGDYSLEFVDDCIQNRIGSFRDALDRKAKAETLRSTFAALLNKKIDYLSKEALLVAASNLTEKA